MAHPTLGNLARRLIWDCERRPVPARRPSLSPFRPPSPFRRGRAGEGFPADTPVRLWHPLHAPDIATVGRWRDTLEERGLVQPFKQAHREVYLLTDAERATRTYSNRFAAHILKQHQFNSLAVLRGWKNQLRLMVDDSYPPATKLLPQHNLRAEFWVEGIGDDYGTDTNETGTYLRLATDQVRFYPLDSPTNYAHAGGGGYSANFRDAPAEPVSLDQIPPLVLSEVLRDVDLFVGVASLGNDPNWSDGGPQGRFRDYWRDYAFGDLGESAKTRADVLLRLLPRLKIARAPTSTASFWSSGATCAPIKSTWAAATSSWSRTTSTCASSPSPAPTRAAFRSPSRATERSASSSAKPSCSPTTPASPNPPSRAKSG